MTIFPVTLNLFFDTFDHLGSTNWPGCNLSDYSGWSGYDLNVSVSYNHIFVCRLYTC